MLELTDFDDSKISYLARISRGHHVDTLLVPREYKDTIHIPMSLVASFGSFD